MKPTSIQEARALVRQANTFVGGWAVVAGFRAKFGRLCAMFEDPTYPLNRVYVYVYVPANSALRPDQVYSWDYVPFDPEVHRNRHLQSGSSALPLTVTDWVRVLTDLKKTCLERDLPTNPKGEEPCINL